MRHTTILVLQSTVFESSLSACVVVYPVCRTALFLEVVHVTGTVTVDNVPMTRLALCYSLLRRFADHFVFPITSTINMSLSFGVFSR